MNPETVEIGAAVYAELARDAARWRWVEPRLQWNPRRMGWVEFNANPESMDDTFVDSIDRQIKNGTAK